MADTFELLTHCLHAGVAGQSLPVPMDDKFWPELMSGRFTSEGTRRIAQDGGWMVSLWQAADFAQWEMHPEGDEIFFMVAGAIDVIFERDKGEHKFRLATGHGCVIPKGTWHRAKLVEPGQVMIMTWGKGTRHKPI